MATRKRETDPLIELDREVGRRGSLFEFMEMAWHVIEPNVPFFGQWHVGAQCEHYQALEEGQIDWLLVNVPPGCSKSRISGVFYPTWAWLRDPSLRFGHFSFDGDLTLRSTRDSLALVQSKWFQDRWGDQIKVPARDPAAGSWYNSEGGWRFASSVDGKATGNHFNRQIIDDPLKPKSISPVILAQTKAWFSNTMSTRWQNGKRKARAIVMQRLHDDDTSAQALAEGKYVHLMLPMEYDSHRKCTVYLSSTGKCTNDPEHAVGTFFQDPRSVEDELLCPEFISPEDVATLKRELGPMESAGQLQQSPTQKGGAIFKEWNVRYWLSSGFDATHLDVEQVLGPDGDYVKRVWCRLPNRFDVMWQSWDFAFKDLKTSDYVVGMVWGRYKADYFLLWRFRERIDFNASVQMVRVASQNFPKARAKLIEDKANGTAVMNALKGQLSGITPVEPDGGKEARAAAVSPLHAAGNVYYPDPRMPGYEWVLQHKDEMGKFPFGKNDDSVDCETQALNWGSTGFKQFVAAMDRLRGRNPASARLRNILASIRGVGHT